MKNIILIVSDDQPYDTTALAMPKSKARSGVTWFSNGTSQSVVCEPSRSSILTGQNDTRHGVINNPYDKYFRENETLATWLKSVGYKTALFGKYFNGYPFNRGPYIPSGWDDWHADYGSQLGSFTVLNDNGVINTYPKNANNLHCDLLASKAVDFINTASQPFFMYVAPTSPHDPAAVATRYKTTFNTTPMPRTPAFNGVPTDSPLWVSNLLPQNSSTMDNRRRGVWRATLAVDDLVDNIFQTLATHNLLDNTVIIFTTDQGRALGEHRWTSKRTVYDETVRVPLFTYGLNVTGHEVVSLTDIAPTICSVAGVTPSIVQDGVIIGQRTDAYIHWIGGGAGGKYTQSLATPAFNALRNANWKYSELPVSPLSTGEQELYDLITDPYEMNNLIHDPAYASIKDELSTRLQTLKTP